MKIVRTTPTARFVREARWDRREFPSPTGDATFVLRDSFEWHMGATGWKASLLRRGFNITLWHWRMSRLAGRTGFQDDSPQPWSADGRTLVLVTWDRENPVCLYDLGRRTVTRLPGSAFPHSTLWSPGRDRLLVVFQGRGLIYDSTGRIVSTAEWTSAPNEPVHAYWNQGDQFFIVGRRSPRAKTTLTCYSCETGQELESHDLDPLDFLPYDETVVREISRERFTLATKPGTWAIGRLLDTWAESQFIPERRLLLLSTYRPTGVPRVERDQLVCPARIQWLEVEIE